MHGNQGDIGLADSSVQQFSNAGLTEALKKSGAESDTWRVRTAG